MDLHDWFLVTDSRAKGTFICRYTEACENPYAILRGEEVVKAPMTFEHHMGSKVHEVIWSSQLSLVLISERIQSVLRRNEFTGWSAIESIVKDKWVDILKGYGCLVVTGRAGRVDRTKAKCEERPPRVSGGRPNIVRMGLYVDFSRWDGADIIVPEIGIDILVNKKVRETLISAGVTGMEFTRLDHYESIDWDATRELWKRLGLN